MENGHSGIREFGKCRLDIGKKVLWANGQPVALPLKAAELLCVLVERPGEVIGKDEIWAAVWQDTFVEETNLTHNIYLLRKTLKDLGENDLIKTVPRRGYRFAGDVRVIENGDLIIERHTRTRTLIEVEERRRNDQQSRPSRVLIAVLLAGLTVAAAFLGYNAWQDTAGPEIRSIAVLPFTTIGAPADERHGVGLSDMLITRLSHIRHITVRPTSAILDLPDHDPVAVGQRLAVDAVLEGTIYQIGDRIRVRARLVSVTGQGQVVWSGEFEKAAGDEMKLQADIARQVADALAVNLNPNETNALARRYTEDPDAYELYLMGRLEWNKRQTAGILEAQRLFRNAIEKDPNFALAYVGLADTYMVDTIGEKASALQKAIELDPNLAEAYASLGFVHIFERWNWLEAEHNLRRSIELNPGYASAHHWYALLLTIQGRHEEAKAEMQKALDINPRSHNFLAGLGQIYYFNREYGEAEAYCLRALEVYPDFNFAYEYLEDIYLKTGRYEEAVEAQINAQRTFDVLPNEPAERERERRKSYDVRMEIFRTGGIEKFMRSRIAETTDPSGAHFFATKYAFLGEKEKALDNLERAFQGKGFLSAFIKADPVFDDLRSEPRYQAILQKMGL